MVSLVRVALSLALLWGEGEEVEGERRVVGAVGDVQL